MKKCILFIFMISFCVSLNGQISDSLSIAPNPFVKRTHLYFSFSQNDTVSIIVYNVNGQTLTNVMTKYTDSVMISGGYQDSLKMDVYSDGIYFVQLKLGHRKTITKKIIKSSTANVFENTNNFEDVKAYPNPFNDKLYIEANESNKISVINCYGQTVCVLENQKKEIDLGSFSSGIYFLKLQSETKTQTFKFIKE